MSLDNLSNWELLRKFANAVIANGEQVGKEMGEEAGELFEEVLGRMAQTPDNLQAQERRMGIVQ